MRSLGVVVLYILKDQIVEVLQTNGYEMVETLALDLTCAITNTTSNSFVSTVIALQNTAES